MRLTVPDEMTPELLGIAGEDADLFASGAAPNAPTGIEAFPDLGEHGLEASAYPRHRLNLFAGVPPEAAPSVPAPAAAPVASGIDAFPDLMDDSQNTSFDVRVTGHAASDDPE